MNLGSYVLNRTGNVRVSNDENYEIARKHFLGFLKSPFLALIDEDSEDELELWVQKQIDGDVDVMGLMCTLELVDHFRFISKDFSYTHSFYHQTFGYFILGDIIFGEIILREIILGVTRILGF